MYDAVVKRTSISLPDELAVTLDREARRRGVSVSEVARAALLTHFEIDADEPRAVPFAAVVNLEEVPGAADLDAALSEDWPDHVARDR